MAGEYQGIFGKKSAFVSLVLMLIGIIGSIALRLVLPLSRIGNLYASISWYFAMILFVVFYTYRLYVEEKRQAIIIRNRLMEKTKEGKLNTEDLNKIRTILNSLLVSKVKVNYLFLLIITIIFLIFQLFIDIIL
jgi:hypothetical protein